MGRKLKHLWMLSLSLSLFSAPAVAHSDLWDGLIKKLAKRGNNLTITTNKGTPKSVAFKGLLEVPQTIHVLNGNGQVNATAAQIVFDGQIVCNYSPSTNLILFNRIYNFKNCSDGSRAYSDIQVYSKVEIRLNAAQSTNTVLQVVLKIVRQDEESYGLVFPYITPAEGNILVFNGEAWVPKDPSEILPKNEDGEDGATGPMGPQGPQGAIGPQGPAGVAGVKGDKGEKGDKGDKGDKGETGAAGVAGTAGAIGPQGPAGAVGPQGPAGVAGAAGAIGPQGPVGATGAIGPQGPVGATGAIGPQGPVGATGAQGPKGDTGATGAIGPQGPVGATGPQGPAGPMGFMGPQGPAGQAGADGLPGAIGPVGPQGPMGVQGPKGDKGDSGSGSYIAYMRDERAPGVHGGVCTAGSWMTRSLNTLGGDTDFISLSNNRFVLQPGKYFIEIIAPGHGVNQHQAKLKVLETNADVLYGTNVSSPSNTPSTALSIIMGEIVVAEASTFEIQHRCATTRADSGFGIAANFGTPETYTQVKIIKK